MPCREVGCHEGSCTDTAGCDALKHAASKSGFGEFGKLTCKKPSCFELMGWGLNSMIRQRASERMVAATYWSAVAMAKVTR